MSKLTPEGDLFTQMSKCSEDVTSCGDGPMCLVQKGVCVKQECSQKGDSGCASEKLGVPHLLSD